MCVYTHSPALAPEQHLVPTCDHCEEGVLLRDFQEPAGWARSALLSSGNRGDLHRFPHIPLATHRRSSQRDVFHDV